MKSLRLFALLLLLTPIVSAGAPAYELFAHTNLVAWCIVPFDAKKRGPEERAAMLERLGFKMFAYDYRAEHVPTFEAEIEALQRHHVRLLAWWFPTELNAEAKQILALLQRHQQRDVQLWVTGGGEPTKSAAEWQQRVIAEANRIQPIAVAAGDIGCVVGLYNHGAWFGEPENQIAIIENLRARGITNVGLVYNLHHGHAQLPRFAGLLARMKPYLLALNLNGMFRDGATTGRQIVPLGQGDLDAEWLGIIRDSGWQGPIGILNHTDEDAESRLQDNLDGLDWLLRQTPGHPAGNKPRPAPGAIRSRRNLRPTQRVTGRSRTRANARNCRCIKPFPPRLRVSLPPRTACRSARFIARGNGRTATTAARASPRSTRSIGVT